jgi:hypothetical protein
MGAESRPTFALEVDGIVRSQINGVGILNNLSTFDLEFGIDVSSIVRQVGLPRGYRSDDNDIAGIEGHQAFLGVS